jgi:hypothetical protein
MMSGSSMHRNRATSVALALKIGCAAIASAASGCAATNLDKNAGFNRKSDEAVVILAAPERSTLWLYAGIDDGVNRTCGGFFKPAARLSPEGGFVVAKLPARTGDQIYAIAEMAPGPEANHGLRPTTNVKVPVFSAEAGQITFVGGVSLLGVGRSLDLVPNPSVTTERAARYLAKSYPRVSGPVVKGKMDWVYLTSDCSRL